MPCRSYEDNDCSGYISQADNATAAACDLASILRLHVRRWEEMLKPDTVKWIARHDAEDKKRKREEKAERDRQDAIRRGKAKLSKKEREALGIR